MMYARNWNAELEKLRHEASEAPNFETVVLNIKQLASKIHVSYLFENEGKELLQKLCLLISATASGKSYGDWQKFAGYLGLITEQIKCIDYDFKGLQDPTYYVLLAFSQSADATMDKIIDSLQKLDRLDIINRVTDCFNNCLQDIVQNKSSHLKNGLYIPNSMPRAPLVLSPVTKNQSDTVCYNPAKQHVNNRKVNQKYGSVVLLTFAEDGHATAIEMARILRSKEPKIGVIILQEQEKHVYSKAEEFIEDCFKQVNYIVPILTEGYIAKINNCTFTQHDSSNLDSKYLRYIFSLLRYEFVKQDCVNNRVRCIIPDKQIKNVSTSDLHPTLQAWFRERDMHLFSERILLQKF